MGEFVLIFIVGIIVGMCNITLYNYISQDYSRYKKNNHVLDNLLEKIPNVEFDRRLSTLFYFKYYDTNILISLKDGVKYLSINDEIQNNYVTDLRVKEICNKLFEIHYNKCFIEVTTINNIVYSNEYLKKLYPDHYNYYNNKSEVDNIYEEHEAKHDIDDILDQISQRGRSSLTKEQIEFLKNYK